MAKRGLTEFSTRRARQRVASDNGCYHQKVVNLSRPAILLKMEEPRKPAQIEREFVKAFTNELQHGRRSYRSQVHHLRRLCDRFCLRLRAYPDVATEIKRRVAEELFNLAISNAKGISACRARFRALSSLGFANTERKGHFSLLYARAAMERGHHRVANRIAGEAAKELSRSLVKRRSLLGREIIALLRELE